MWTKQNTTLCRDRFTLQNIFKLELEEQQNTFSMMTNDEAVNEFVEILEQYRADCEKLGNYAEADKARCRLDELRMHEENRRREALRSRQIAEKLGVEEAHMLEFQQFNREWDQKIVEFETKSSQQLNEMQERHATEILAFQKNLISKNNKPKFSKDLLNLRRVQETMAKQRNYVEANKMKVQADTLEAFEMDRWQTTRQTHLLAKEDQFKGTKRSEIQALHKRIQTGRNDHKKLRHQELERLLQGYQNVKAELEVQHNMERTKLEKQFVSASKSMSTMLSGDLKINAKLIKN